MSVFPQWFHVRKTIYCARCYVDVGRRDRDTVVRDEAEFRQTILPHIQNIQLAQLEAATGLSKTYLSNIRLGRQTPKRVHWQALTDATKAGTRRPEGPTSTR
jgi:hypothetical protein